MKKAGEKLISWSPVIALLLFGLVAWQFLHYEGEEGGKELLSAACKKETPTEVSRDPFVIIYREKGCSSVSSLTSERLFDDLLWLDSVSSKVGLPEVRKGTVIDIRPGEPRIISRFGRPGALIIPPSEEITRRYLLAKGVNLLVLREAFPKTPEKTRELAAGALALAFLERDSFRVLAPSEEKDLAERISINWPKALEDCEAPCKPNDLLGQ